MLKKLLILPILGSILGLGAFASADTVDGFTSDTAICKSSLSDLYDGDYFSSLFSSDCSFANDEDLYDNDVYVCSTSSVVPFGYNIGDYINFNTSPSCLSNAISLSISDYSYAFCGEDGNQNEENCNLSSMFLYVSRSPITYSSSSDSSDSSLGVPEIPASFTSGLTSLVNNFGGTIANWLPTIILVALGIYAIFALFRVVRNYARSTFRG